MTGDELWKSDGTAAGTVRVGHSGTTSNFSPRDLTNVGGTLYFTASTNETGREVWKSDGTAAGTNVYQEVVSGPGDSLPEQLTNVNGALVFAASNGVIGKELWRYDLVANTSSVDDIHRGTLDSNPRNFVQAGNNVFFTASNGTIGEELWKVNTNGTGATLVKDIRIGDQPSQISGMTNVNGTLYFSAHEICQQVDLAAFSFGKATARRLAQLWSAKLWLSWVTHLPPGLTNLNGKLIFSATGADGHELWTSDGTARNHSTEGHRCRPRQQHGFAQQRLRRQWHTCLLLRQ